MTRKRIHDLDLPPRCSRRNGKISYRPPSGGRVTFHDLPRNATPRDIWEKYELVVRSHRPHSLQTIAESYFNSLTYQKYSPRTTKNHRDYLKSLTRVFGDSDFSKAKPVHITKWRNARCQVAKEQGNKELSFLRVVLDHAVEIGLLHDNPANKVKKLPLTKNEQVAKRKAKRDSYITNQQYDKFYQIAGPVLRASIEILYCTGIRMGDLLRLKWSDVHDGYIHIEEGKTANEYRKEITPRLEAALEQARKLPGVHLSPCVIHNRKGHKYTEDGFGSLWQYTRLRLLPQDRFGIHKIRSKAITDWKGDRKDKWMFSKHKTESMIDQYDLSIPTSPSH